MRPLVADNGSDVDGWFVGAVVLVALVVYVVVEIRRYRREQARLAPVVRPIEQPKADEVPRRPRFCSRIGCPNEPVVSVNGWLLCLAHRPRPAVTTKEIPVATTEAEFPTPVRIDVAPDGSLITVRREDLPAVANVAFYRATMTYDQLEDTYVRARARRLGVGGGGDL